MRNTQTHILVIRLSAMGDVAMTVPVLRAFVAQHKQIKVTVLSKTFLEPLFNDIPNVNFYAADVEGKHKGFLGLRKLFVELKQLKITHVADMHNVLRSKVLTSFFKSYGYKVATIDKGRAEKKALTRIEHKVFKQLKTSHQRYADVFGRLGFFVDLLKPSSFIKPDLFESTKSLIDTANYKQWVGIAPFATYKSKTYPLDLLEQVIKGLSEKGYQLFLFGGKSDVSILSNLAQKYSNTICIAGKLGGLENELNLIANLDLMLSMDSGNAHFAAMQHVKTITLWGATHPFAGFAPFGQPSDFCLLPDLKQYPNLPCSVYGNKVCEGYEDVMRSISPKIVIDKIVNVLS